MGAAAKGLVAWYRGEGSAADASGNGKTLTWGGTEAYMTGRLGKAFDLNGTSSLARSYEAAMNPSVFSVSAWARCTGGAGVYRAVAAGRRTPPTNGGWWLYASNTNRWGFVIADAQATPTYQSTLGSTVVVDSWIHLTATWDGTTMSLYENGAFVSSATPTGFTPNSTSSFFVGALATNTYRFPGQLDEVMIFNRALAAREIRAIYATGWPGSAI